MITNMKDYKILIYNDEDLEYMGGCLKYVDQRDDLIEITTTRDIYRQFTKGLDAQITFTFFDHWNSDVVQLDPTLMKRIAKYNKEKEIEKLDKKIKEKENKLKELDDLLKDREKRWSKVQKYIANMYDLDINTDDGDDNYDDYDLDY